MSFDSQIGKGVNSILDIDTVEKRIVPATKEAKEQRIAEIEAAYKEAQERWKTLDEDIATIDKILESRKRQFGLWGGMNWTKTMKITVGAAGILAGTAIPLRDGQLPLHGEKPKEIPYTPPRANTPPSDTTIHLYDTTSGTTIPKTPALEPAPVAPSQPATGEKEPNVSDTTSTPSIENSKPARKPSPSDTLPAEQRNGPKTLPTGLPGTTWPGPGLPPPVKREKIKKDSLPGVAQPSGEIGPWKPANKKPDTVSEKKNVPFVAPPVKIQKPDTTHVAPSQLEKPDEEVIDDRDFPGTENKDETEDDGLGGYNSSQRHDDSTHIKVETIIHKGGEEYAKNPSMKGDSYLKLTPAPGYHMEMIKGYPTQDEINAFAAPEGRVLKMPDPETKLSRAQYIESRTFLENSDVQFMNRIEGNPDEFFIYLHNQAQDQSVGAYVMESNNTLFAIDKNGFLMFELPLPESTTSAGRTFIKIVKNEGENVGHLERDGVPFNIPGIPEAKMEQLIKNGVLGGGAKGTDGFFYYALPKNAPGTDENPRTENTILNYLDPRTGVVGQKTYSALHAHNQAILTSYRMNEKHYAVWEKTTQEYAGDNAGVSGHEGMRRRPAPRYTRKVNNLLGNIHNGTARNAREKGVMESDLKLPKKSPGSQKKNVQGKKK